MTGGNRHDARDLLSEMQAGGYQYVSTGSELAVVVPKRAMDELARQLGASGAESVEVAVSNNQIADRNVVLARSATSATDAP